MSPRRFFRALAERRRQRNQDPYTREQMASFRCRVQRLIEAAKS